MVVICTLRPTSVLSLPFLRVADFFNFSVNFCPACRKTAAVAKD